jgi:hypothetical protein
VFTARYGLSLYLKLVLLFHSIGPKRVADMLESVGPSSAAVSVVVLNLYENSGYFFI